MAIIKNPLTIVQTGGESQVPEYMSAKNFTFDGNTCTGYVGDNTLPEIIVPRSYSTISTVETVVGAKVLDKTALPSVVMEFVSATFSDGENNTHIYSSPTELEMLEGDFPNDCYLVSMEVSDVFNFDFLNQAYDMQILQFPININGQSFSDGMTAFDYIMHDNITNVNFGGDVEIISYVDGNDYQVTRVSCIEPTVSGFKNYKNRIILLSNITTIGAWAFQGCINLTSIEIPNSITNMGVQVFMSCSNLKNVVLPEGITEITTNEFSFCRSLTSINIPSSVIKINNSAFNSCSSLRSVTIPENVTSIGISAFRGCTSLTTVTLEATIPPTIQSNTFDDTVQTFYVPDASVETYKTATNWVNYADKIFAIPTV